MKAGASTIHGNGGNDRFELYVGGTVYGDTESDLFNIRGGNGLIADGGSEDDRFNFVAGSTNVLLHGGSGNDDFFGYNKAISGTVYGDSGNDYFVEFRGSVVLRGGSGNDTYRADATSAATFIELAGEGIDTVQVARGVIAYTLPSNVENISVVGFSGSIPGPSALIGNALNNTIVAHDNVETIGGLGGNDTVYGGVGDDYLDGGTGNDTLQGDAGNDTLQGRTGDDAMDGGAGNDVYYLDSPFDAVTENAGAGTDLVRVYVNGYTLAPNVENGILGGVLVALAGNGLDNVLTGNNADNTIVGNAGNDTIRGGAGSDTLYGNAGDDLILAGDDSDSLYGGDGADTLNGGLGGNALYGEAGNDILVGGAGSELLIGGLGADTITTGGGPDKIDYQAVADSATGSSDLITDFNAAGDVLDLSGIDANTTIAGDQSFTLYSSKPAIGTPGDLWYVDAGDGVHLTLFGDVNGDTFADFELRLVISSGIFDASDILL